MLKKIKKYTKGVIPKKIDKKNNKTVAIIIGAIIIIFIFYYNSPGATLTRECKKIANSFNWNESSKVAGKAYVMSRCLNGKSIN